MLSHVSSSVANMCVLICMSHTPFHTHTHISSQSDKLIHTCPHTPPRQSTHTKPTDAQDANVYSSLTHVRQNQQRGIHSRLCVCLPTRIHTQIDPEQISNTAKAGVRTPSGELHPPTSNVSFGRPRTIKEL